MKWGREPFLRSHYMHIWRRIVQILSAVLTHYSWLQDQNIDHTPVGLKLSTRPLYQTTPKDEIYQFVNP